MEYFYDYIGDNDHTYETEYNSHEDNTRLNIKKYFIGTTLEYREEYTYLVGGYGMKATTNGGTNRFTTEGITKTKNRP